MGLFIPKKLWCEAPAVAEPGAAIGRILVMIGMSTGGICLRCNCCSAARTGQTDPVVLRSFHHVSWIFGHTTMIFALCLAAVNAAGWFLLQKYRSYLHQQMLDVIVQDHIARGRPARRVKASELPNAALPPAFRLPANNPQRPVVM
jgi:hypothetical protein